MLKVGSRGKAVKNWQVWLNKNGFKAGSADAVFGPKTKAAVKRFQAKVHISPDGIIGPQTIRQRRLYKIKKILKRIPPKPLPTRGRLIVVDIGHAYGGSNGLRRYDRGCSGYGLVEASECQKITVLIAGLLPSRYNVITPMTHKGLRGSYASRHRYANRIGAKLYMQLHLDWSGAPTGSLVEVSKNCYSRTLTSARYLVTRLSQRLKIKSRGVTRLGPGSRGYVCIKNTNMPAWLLEPISLTRKGVSILKSGGRAQIAQAIVETIVKYF